MRDSGCGRSFRRCLQPVNSSSWLSCEVLPNVISRHRGIRVRRRLKRVPTVQSVRTQDSLILQSLPQVSQVAMGFPCLTCRFKQCSLWHQSTQGMLGRLISRHIPAHSSFRCPWEGNVFSPSSYLRAAVWAVMKHVLKLPNGQKLISTSHQKKKKI